MKVNKKLFGTTKNGEEVYLYTLENDAGISVSISEFGAAIVKLLVPDRDGKISDIIGGYDCLSSYEDGDGYQGAIVGRFGNRIAKGIFTLDGATYKLYINNGENHLHGGKIGFSHKVWASEIIENGDSVSLKFSLVSPDGDEGYPGELKVGVIYTLDKDSLCISYSATTNKKTVLNLTNHTYFNLAGYDSGKIFDHVIKISADRFLPTDAGLIPTGEIASVSGTPFDFREPKAIGRDFYADDINLKNALGYDHCLVFDESVGVDSPKIVVKENNSGRAMEVYTSMPAVHFYTGNFLNNPDYPFKGGYPQATQNAFCLETENMPDSVNHENFTDCTLDVGQKFESFTKFRFFTV